MSSKQTCLGLTHSVCTKFVFAEPKLQLIIITTAPHYNQEKRVAAA